MCAAKVTLPSATEVKVTRIFAAPAHLVWRAYTEPELLKRWLLGPPGWLMPTCEVDLQVGGRYRWRWRNVEESREFGFHGVFLHIEPDTQIMHTQIFDPGTVGGIMAATAVITVTFEEASDNTTVVTAMKFESAEDRDAAISTGMTDGMEASYRLLGTLLAELSRRKERGVA